MSEAALRAAIPSHVPDNSPTTPTVIELRSIHRSLGQLECESGKHTCEDLAYYRERLAAIDAARSGGIFAGGIDHDDPSKTRIPVGQAECANELAESYAILERLTATAAPMPTPVKMLYDQLVSIKRQLQSVTPEHLGSLQRSLDDIDSQSQEGGGVFGGSLVHGDIPPGQAVLSELLAECYDLVAAAQQKQQ